MALSAEEINILFLIWLYRRTNSIGIKTAKTLDLAINRAIAVVNKDGPLKSGPTVASIFRTAGLEAVNVFTAAVVKEVPKVVAFADREIAAAQRSNASRVIDSRVIDSKVDQKAVKDLPAVARVSAKGPGSAGPGSVGLDFADVADDLAVNSAIRSAASMGSVELTVKAQNPINSLERQIARGFILPDGTLLTDALRGPAANANTLFERRIRQAIITEQPRAELIETLQTEAARQVRYLEVEGRTGAQSLANGITNSRQQQAGITNVLFVAVMDSRTSDQCRALDGRVFPIDEAPAPPLHRSCRSHLAPMVGVATGVSVAPTSLDWLAQQTLETQNRLLGVDGGEAFRESGRLT